MNITDFDFHLPEELIAQTPLKDRASSRLLTLHRDTKKIEHQYFTDIKSHFKKGDCLVLNDTRVLPARLYGIKRDTGAKIEVDRKSTLLYSSHVAISYSVFCLEKKNQEYLIYMLIIRLI